MDHFFPLIEANIINLCSFTKLWELKLFKLRSLSVFIDRSSQKHGFFAKAWLMLKPNEKVDLS